MLKHYVAGIGFDTIKEIFPDRTGMRSLVCISDINMQMTR